MSNIFNTIHTALTSLGYEVSEQGTYKSGSIRPETYITYFIVDSPDVSYADNVPTAKVYRIQITMYSKKPSIIQGAEAALKNALIPAGFMRAGGGSLPFSETTGHYRWRNDFRYYETED